MGTACFSGVFCVCFEVEGPWVRCVMSSSSSTEDVYGGHDESKDVPLLESLSSGNELSEKLLCGAGGSGGDDAANAGMRSGTRSSSAKNELCMSRSLHSSEQ